MDYEAIRRAQLEAERVAASENGGAPHEARLKVYMAARQSGKSYYHKLMASGFDKNCPACERGHGITLLKQMRIVVLPSTQQLLHELRSYKYDPDRAAAISALDAARQTDHERANASATDAVNESYNAAWTPASDAGWPT